VLYVAAERAALVRRRFAAWRLSHDINDIPLAILSGTIDLRSTRDASGSLTLCIVSKIKLDKKAS